VGGFDVSGAVIVDVEVYCLVEICGVPGVFMFVGSFGAARGGYIVMLVVLD